MNGKRSSGKSSGALAVLEPPVDTAPAPATGCKHRQWCRSNRADDGGDCWADIATIPATGTSPKRVDPIDGAIYPVINVMLSTFAVADGGDGQDRVTINVSAGGDVCEDVELSYTEACKLIEALDTPLNRIDGKA